jgi:threonine aldolase
MAIELRSDTFTLPTEEMYEELYKANLGDDVYGEDPTVAALEKLAAQLTGKERALLVTSGTQANLVAVLSQCRRGSEVIVGQSSDIFNFESGGISAIGGVMPRPVPDQDGYPTIDDLRTELRGHDIHVGATELICLENTHQRSGGRPIPINQLASIGTVAREAGIPIHMDGARLFNASVALGVEVREVARYADSVSFCLSKGLSCPIGSLVCGGTAFIERARWVRKLLGGGMRQAGWIAAAGLVALRTYRSTIEADHANARQLAGLLKDVDGLVIEPDDVQTNIVLIDVRMTGLTASEFVARLWATGVRALPVAPTEVRLVTHRGVTPVQIRQVALACHQVARGDN